jgi:hypothetical protein
VIGVVEPDVVLCEGLGADSSARVLSFAWNRVDGEAFRNLCKVKREFSVNVLAQLQILDLHRLDRFGQSEAKNA